MCRRLVSSLLVVGTCLWSGVSPAGAQTEDGTNKAFVRDLFFQDVVDAQESVVLVNQIARDSADAIAKFVSLALTSAPVASSSSGFSYVRDSVTGELALRSESFGPTFAERPLTNGRGVWNFGAHYQFSATVFEGGFGTADGKDTGLPVFDNTATYLSDGFVQYITKRAFLETRSHTFHLFTSYGLTDRLDIGVVLPIISLTLEGRTEEAYDLTRQFNVGETNPVNRPTPTGIRIVQPNSTSSASGLGDVMVRLKFAVAGQMSDGVAVAADVRAPTGDEDELLGAGDASVKLMMILAKSGFGPASFHANAGYGLGGLSDEFTFVVGADAALLSRKQLTPSISLLGRTLKEGVQPERIPTVRRTVDTGVTGTRDIVVDRFIWENESMTMLQMAAGVKWNVSGFWLLNASVLVPLNQKGFQAGVSPVIGLERTWR